MRLNPINIFDFDGTLTTETWPKFLVWVKKYGYSGERRNNKLEKALVQYRETHDGDALETFFCFFNDLLVNNNDTLTDNELIEGEKYIVYNPGLIEYLKESNANNYIVSGGLKDFLDGLNISKFFVCSYGTQVRRNNDGLITGIGEIMTDDKKILAIKDILRKNNRKENDCTNVYYIGDGYSDEVAMRFVHNNGGKAIFVYQPLKEDELSDYISKIYNVLNKDGIVDYSILANYCSGSELYNVLKR